MAQPKITPFLWYLKDAEAAAAHYVSVFPDSRITRVVTLPSESPSGPAGSVKVVDFQLSGQAFCAMTAGGAEAFNHAVSFVVNCETQAEVDHYWERLMEGGGQPEACGWLRDRWGVAWQITPVQLVTWMNDADRTRGKRVADEMMKQVKLDIAALQAAYEGR